MPNKPFEPPVSASDGIRQQLERSYKASNIPESLSVNRNQAISAARNITPTSIKAGAEIGNLAVGSSLPGANLNNRPFGVSTRGYAVPIGVGTAINFAANVAQGESVERAASRASGAAAGAYAGAIVGGAIGGLLTLPVGGVGATVLSTVGSLVGSFAGDVAGGNLFDFFNRFKGEPKNRIISTQAVITEPPPFKGGQSPVEYIVQLEVTYHSYNEPQQVIRQSTKEGLGPITGFERLDAGSFYAHYLIFAGKYNLVFYETKDSEFDRNGPVVDSIKITSIIRKDGLPDTGGDLPSKIASRPGGKTIQTPPGASPTTSIPGGKLQNIVPPSADLPNQQNKRKPVAIQIPPNTSIRFSFDPSIKLPPFTFQSETSATINVGPAKPNPATGKTETPITVKALGNEPINLIAPGDAPVILNIPGQEPITISPDGSTKPTGLIQSLSDPARAFVPTPVKPTTPTLPGTTPENPATPTTPEIPQLPNFKDRDLQEIGLTLIGITSLLKGLQNNTSTQALENAAAAGTCRTTQPGGCTSNAMNSAVQKGNKDLLGGLNTVGQGADLLLLREINNKLGPQIPGGVSSGLGRLSKFLGIDRIFNLLNFLAILHNASMLSTSLKITLLETLSSVGNATGLLQTSEGENVDLNQVFNQGIESFVVSLIGAEAWASLKLTWRKYSPIYRAMNNGLSHIGNMFSSIGNGIEVLGERTGKIGNAIRAAGVVRDNAYNHMSERMTVHTSKFMTFQTTVNGVTEALETINEVAESTIEGQESYAEAVKATAEFKTLLNESDKDTPSADAENKAIKAEAEKIKENLVKDPTGEDETGLLSFLTDL